MKRDQLTVKASRAAARRFIADINAHAIEQWSTRTVEDYLPKGWVFFDPNAISDGDFHPVTVEHVGMVIRLNAQRLSAHQGE
jgi:hypothetical protein